MTHNTVLVTQLTHDDIDGVYAGLRPLLAGESEETSKLSREHAVATPSPGLVAIAGGKQDEGAESSSCCGRRRDVATADKFHRTGWSRSRSSTFSKHQ